ncbi:MAG: hypothetical protein P0116_14330 [Candidatus Nitrosocosmicus sp.]|nr:hypothetical protein [Candidatus Nitrosocosmicus sp.]
MTWSSKSIRQAIAVYDKALSINQVTMLAYYIEIDLLRNLKYNESVNTYDKILS